MDLVHSDRCNGAGNSKQAFTRLSLDITTTERGISYQRKNRLIANLVQMQEWRLLYPKHRMLRVQEFLLCDEPLLVPQRIGKTAAFAQP
jgi:hypothetical protein